MPDDRGPSFGPEAAVGLSYERLAAAHEAREVALRACREAIRASGLAIRALHAGEPAEAERLTATAAAALSRAQEALTPFPRLAAAGFLHDAEKEVAEARLTACLLAGDDLEPAEVVGVPDAAWLNGLAEAASELRRDLLDALRRDDPGRAEALMERMDACYLALTAVDQPDAVTGGLGRTTDALRAVVERSRSDLTATLLQGRLRASLDAVRTRLEERGAG